MSVRSATEADADAIQQVARESWHAVYDSILGPDRIDAKVDSWYDPERLVNDDITDPHRPFFVAVAEESVIGFVEAVPDESDGDKAHLYRIYVVPEYWGRGVGSSLLEHIETTLKERGFVHLELSVLAENDVGVGFYESSGFDRISTVHNDQLDIREYEYQKRL